MPHLYTGTKTDGARNQCAAILARLQRGERLTPLDAQRLPDIRSMRLGARIWDLRCAGHDIRQCMVKTRSRKRVAQYWMEVAR